RLPISLPIGVPHLPGRWHRGAGTATTTGRSKVVLVIRVPRLHLPSAPSILDRYISRLYARVVGLSFLALLGLFYISTFIDRADKLFKGQASLRMVAELLVYSTPQFVYYVIPIAALLSVLVTFGILSRTSELTVMKACGVSLYRLALPVVTLSLVWSALLFGLEQQILGRANRQAMAIDDEIKGRPPKTLNPANRRWIIGRDGSIYHYNFYDPRDKTLTGLMIYRPDSRTWRLASNLFASRARFGTEWIGDTGWSQDLTSQPPVWKPFSGQTLKL